MCKRRSHRMWCCDIVCRCHTYSTQPSKIYRFINASTNGVSSVPPRNWTFPWQGCSRIAPPTTRAICSDTKRRPHLRKKCNSS